MNRSLLAVDIGNSAIKVARFGFFPAPAPAVAAAAADHNVTTNLPEPLALLEWRTSDEPIWFPADWLPSSSALWVVSSVNRGGWERIRNWVTEHRPSDELRTLTYRDLALTVAVDYPERVGMDRLLTAVAANRLRQADRPAIVIDAGTALKVHAVNEQGEFVGGAILPGLGIAARTLAGNTDLLPLVNVLTDGQSPQALGRNTEQAIQSGLYWGAIGAVKELVARMRVELSQDRNAARSESKTGALSRASAAVNVDGVGVDLFVTGGDAGSLVPLLDLPATYIPHLCLRAVALQALQIS
ncbi:MAG: type III pantothenate kinase [Planctomycetota bacterium]